MDINKLQFLLEANKMRIEKGLPPFGYDDRLEKSAQKHADQLPVVAPHSQLRERLIEAGWPADEGPPHMSRADMACNYSEGILEYFQSPVTTDGLHYLVSSGPGEAHYDDFFDPHVNLIGVGINGPHLVIDYGVESEKIRDAL